MILNSHSFAPRLAHVRVLRLSAWPNAPLEALSALLRLLRDKTLSSGFTLLLTDTLEPRELAYDAGSYGALLRRLTEQPAVTHIALDELRCNAERGAALLSLPRLSVRRVCWLLPGVQWLAAPVAQAADNESLLRALEGQTSLTTLTISGVSLMVQELSRVVDIALLHKLPKLVLSASGLGAEHVPELARLLRGSMSLHHLLLQPVTPAMTTAAPLFTAANAALFADALRDNTSLKHLTLSNFGPSWACAAPALCAALEGHPTLESLLLCEQGKVMCVDLSTLDAALAGLLNADAPALWRLELSFDVKATGQPRLKLPLMFAALAHNTHLRALKVGRIDTSDAAMGSSVLPAMLANTGLREAAIVPDDLRDLSATLLGQLKAAMSHLKKFKEQD